MKISFTKKEIIKFIVCVYIPLLLTSYYIVSSYYEKPLTIVGHLLNALFFSYPLNLLINFKFKKFVNWFLVGVLPFSITYFIFIIPEKKISTFPILLVGGAIAANIMYPLGLLGIQTFKEYLEMSKEMTWGRKIGLLFSLIFILISILKRARW